MKSRLSWPSRRIKRANIVASTKRVRRFATMQLQRMLQILSVVGVISLSSTMPAENSVTGPELIRFRLEKEYPNLFELYQHLHTHPELSLHEEKTSQRIAGELRKIEGISVTEKVGGFGV